MTFKEFIKVVEAGGMFTTSGWPGPGQKHPLSTTNKDLYLHQYGTPGMAAPIGPGIFAGSGPGFGNQQVRRMKKNMKK